LIKIYISSKQPNYTKEPGGRNRRRTKTKGIWKDMEVGAGIKSKRKNGHNKNTVTGNEK